MRIVPGVDAVIARVAARQLGLITWRQLLDAGVSRSAIARRLAEGRLHRMFHGVYAVGHPVLAPGARELAAVLACGAGAVVSHVSAAAVWRVGPSVPGPVHVTRGARRRNGPAGVTLHHGSLGAADVRTVGGVPLTAPLRTLRDLAATAGPEDLARAIAEAQARRLVTGRELEVLGRATGHRGAVALRAALGDGPALTRSEAERRLLKLVRQARLPEPEANARLLGYEVDALWRRERLVVEIDGYAFHASRRAFERDRRRDADLAAAGFTVLRITWRQLDGSPAEVVSRLAVVLSRRAGQPAER